MKCINLITGITALLVSSSVVAIPSLQLGPGSGEWEYNEDSQTWVSLTGPSFTMTAIANATKADGGNGKYAWDDESVTQYAYLVAAAVPSTTVDAFDISVTVNDSLISLYTSGYGTPPLEDPNSLASHGIYDTYFEIYQFEFDGPIVDIADMQPGELGTGKGYLEDISIDINSLMLGVEGVHFDLFTVSSPYLNQGDMWDLTNAGGRDLVNAFAPFSHDAESVPEPGMIGLMAIGLIGISLVRRRNAV